MIKLENITTNQMLAGVESGRIVRVVSVEKLGEHAVTLYYKDSEGRLSERMLFRNDEPAISLAESECPWGFDAPADEFKLAVEAQRITLAHLFDPMMAVHTSNVGCARNPSVKKKKLNHSWDSPRNSNLDVPKLVLAREKSMYLELVPARDSPNAGRPFPPLAEISCFF